MNNNHEFSFASYDCVGFDLDNTLVEYHEEELINLCYSYLARHLVSHYNYNADMLKPSAGDSYFLRQGWVLDPPRGNVVNLADDGTILFAFHGSRPLTATELEEMYGFERQWSTAIRYCADLLKLWNKEPGSEIILPLDCFETCISLLFVKMVDSIDNTQKQCVNEYSSVWSDLLATMSYMEEIEDFATNSGDYFVAVTGNPLKYVKKRTEKFLNWLDSFKSSNKTTFLITGSESNYANFVGTNGLCEDWKKYFDIIIYSARKPGFFTQKRPFLVVDTGIEVPFSELKMGACYRGGNWEQLCQLLAVTVNKNDPKCLYMGDNLIEDVCAPAKHGCCDTVAVNQCFAAESEQNDDVARQTQKAFFHGADEKRTIWDELIETYSKARVPSLEWFADGKAVQ